MVGLVAALLGAAAWPAAVHAQTSPRLPDDAGQVMLIRNTLVAVNHGTITGNYTVLRDLASERFRQRNTAADLANTFGNLRRQKLDLSPILVTEPRLTQPPGSDEFRGRLQLVGFFPTRPQAVRFNLIFQYVDGGWLIDEISLSLAPLESLVQQPPAAPQPPPYQPATVQPAGYAAPVERPVARPPQHYAPPGVGYRN
jgi:hypothetical protein